MKKLSILFLSLFVLGACSSNESGTSSKAISSASNESKETIITGDGNVLVAYFSVTNNTKAIAESVHHYLKSDIFEITPSNPYTSADIDYGSDCRANREQNDDKARPEIKYQIQDISKYNTIVLGYPIWWAEAPKIMYTFIESYDFTNKTILPFCTSGSSPIGSSATNLAKSAPNAHWLEGRRFAANTSDDVIHSWLDEYFKKEDNNMNLSIDNQKVDITWEDNDSVKALKKILPLTINMHEYGDFEQTGSIGQSITSNDSQMNVVPGDVVLYNSNAISVFYANSSWSYTRLGHINLNKGELENLLKKPAVTLTIS